MLLHQKITLYTLSALLVLIVLAILLTNIGVFGQEAAKSILAKWGPAGALANVVALYVFVVKGTFRDKTISKLELLIVPPIEPDELKNLKLSKIKWDNENCYIEGEAIGEKKIKLVPTGPESFKVHLDKNIVNNISYDNPLEIFLKDKKGNKWGTQAFYVWTKQIPLVLAEELSKIQHDYGGEY